ncbi:uncharacterized protein [Palaemon carinicauda]|uniref:uncharacterized protein n=1 Tax=Palaemon carinicauda TaxID=392227 RepID=UPI0035B682CF
MLSISCLLFTTLALTTAIAVPDATPSANARTTSQNSRDVLYSYGYVVDAPEYRNFYDHEEDRQGDVTQGRFRVALPDNRLQTVTYRAGRKGYSAQISYDEHPSFQSLRASVGPIREAPEIGQSVVSIPRRGENWKNRNSHNRPEDTNNVDSPTFSRKPQQQRQPQPPSTDFTSPRPPATPPSPAPVRRNPFKGRPSTKRPQRNGQITTRSPSTTRTTTRLGPMAEKLVASSPQRPKVTTPAPLPPKVVSSPHMPEQASIFVSTEGLEDPGILNRLIEAIKVKQEEERLRNPESNDHGHDDDEEDSDERNSKDKPRYSIRDKADVRSRLRAIVHAAKFSPLSNF